MATRGDVGPNQLTEWRFKAAQEFPGVDPTAALHLFARRYKLEECFFVEKGQRFVYGPKINLSEYRHSEWILTPWPTVDLFVLYLLRKGENMPTEVDPNSLQDEKMTIAHPCESGWNLPEGHKRHILQLPRDIMSLILEHMLVKPFTTINLLPGSRHEISLQSYQTYLKRSAKVLCGYINSRAIHEYVDADGKYTELREVIRPAIDASFLRSRKGIYELGIEKLYSSIKPDFKIWRPPPWQPPSILLSNGDVWRPENGTPSMKNKCGRRAIEPAIKAILQRKDITETPGFVFRDEFLYFLHTIGPTNADLLRYLSFSFSFLTDPYESHPKERLVMNNMFANKITLYMPFIRKFCPALETLRIHIVAEISSDDESTMPATVIREVRKMKRLKKLEVVEGKAKMVVEWAEPLMTWLEKREEARMRLKVKMEILQAQRLASGNKT